MMCMWANISPQVLEKLMELALVDMKNFEHGKLDVDQLHNLGVPDDT